MPLPLILAGAAVAAGLYGVKKGVDAHSDNSRAEELNEEGQQIFEGAKRHLAATRQTTSDTLDELGKLKLQVWDRQLGRFVELFGQLKNVELEGGATVGDLKAFSKDELAEMRHISLRAGEVLTGGVTALGAGALAGMAAYGGAFMLGTTATTGTAIATLSGVAATNATLAWLGGGALAAGGFGMAGGMVVLGGLVAGPALAIGGMFLAAKAEENLANARRNVAEARQAAEQMANAASILTAICALAREYNQAIVQLEKRMTQALIDLATVIHEAGTDYAGFTPAQRKKVHLAMNFAQAMKLLLETPLLTKEGAIDESAQRVLQESYAARAALVSGT